MKTLCVHSYKGGTGKTTVAIQLADVLLQKFSEVYLLETDFFMPSFYSLFPEIYKHIQYFSNDLYSDTNLSFEDVFYPHPSKKNLFISFANPFFNSDDPLFTNNQTWFTHIVRQLVHKIMVFKKYHPNALLIIDNPPGYHFVVINNLLLTNIALVLIRPSVYAVDGTKRLIQDIYNRTRSTKNLDTYLLFNQLPKVDDFPELNKWKNDLGSLGYKFLTDIPYSHKTAYYAAKGIAFYPSDSDFFKSINQLSSELKLN